MAILCMYPDPSYASDLRKKDDLHLFRLFEATKVSENHLFGWDLMLEVRTFACFSHNQKPKWSACEYFTSWHESKGIIVLLVTAILSRHRLQT